MVAKVDIANKTACLRLKFVIFSIIVIFCCKINNSFQLNKASLYNLYIFYLSIHSKIPLSVTFTIQKLLYVSTILFNRHRHRRYIHWLYRGWQFKPFINLQSIEQQYLARLNRGLGGRANVFCATFMACSARYFQKLSLPIAQYPPQCGGGFLYKKLRCG